MLAHSLLSMLHTTYVVSTLRYNTYNIQLVAHVDEALPGSLHRGVKEA